MDPTVPNTTPVSEPQMPVAPTPVVALAPIASPIQTPQIAQPVSAQQPQAAFSGFWRRFLANLVDGLILFFVSFIVSLFVGNKAAVSVSTGFSLTGIPSMIVDLLFYVYMVFFIGKFGQTLGKMALKIKVVDATTGGNPGYAKAFLRETVGKFLSSLALGLGYLWMLWDPKKQTWHDKIAGTAVVRV